jgi:LysR family transcriptional regulator, pca operon transcriptional activator
MLDSRLKLRHLQALVTVHGLRSVQASAHELSRTPSAVSKSIAELEGIVGTRLFERTRRGLLPTPAADRLLTQVHRGLALLGDALGEASGGAAAAGPPTVTLGVLPTAAATLAPGAVLRFHALHENAVVRVIEGTNVELLARLRKGDLDLVVGRLAEASMTFDLSFEPLYEEPLVLVAAKGHPLQDVRPLNLARVCAHPVILPEAGTIIRAALDPVLIASGRRRPPRTVETLSDALARYMVAQGDAVWFCAPGVVASDLSDGRFVELDLDLGATRRAVGLSVRSDAPLAPAAAEMADLLRAQARSLRGVAPRR